MELVSVYRDGGTRLYRTKSDDSFSNEGLTLIQCNKQNSQVINIDIYIGTYDMDYENDFYEYTRMVMVNAFLYYDTQKESTVMGRCGQCCQLKKKVL